MENISQFNLNASLGLWLQRLAESPHFRNENVAEMESHVRDSVTNLQSQGLSEEESFLIAIRRVGSVGKLEPEFVKVNRNWPNLFIHGLILILFSTICWLFWGILHLPKMLVAALHGRPLPAFTQLVVSCGDFLVVLPLIALVYCVYVWIRKGDAKCSWMGFFATTMGVFMLITIPILITVLLPVIAFMQQLPTK
jgi:hypothetical protein